MSTNVKKFEEENKSIEIVNTVLDDGIFDGLSPVMQQQYNHACILAKSNFVPDAFRGKPENVLLAMGVGKSLNCDPTEVMRNIFIIKGRIGMQTSFMISLVNRSRVFKGLIYYKVKEDENNKLSAVVNYSDWNDKLPSGKPRIKKKTIRLRNITVTAYAIDRETGNELSHTFTMQEAIDEKYVSNEKYVNTPVTMLKYRSAAILIRTHAPNVLNGMHTIDEVEDVAIAEAQNEMLNNADNAAEKPRDLKSKVANALSKYTNNPASTIIDGHVVEDQVSSDNKEAGNTDDQITSNYNKSDKAIMQAELTTLIMAHKINQDTIDKWCEHFKIKKLDDINIDQMAFCIKGIKNKYGDEIK